MNLTFSTKEKPPPTVAIDPGHLADLVCAARHSPRHPDAVEAALTALAEWGRLR